jgi:AcrR family transcriptional regulator
VRRTAAEAAETRRSILAVARASFAERGYSATGTTELVEQLDLTRGALYHHFTDKADLFAAVFTEVEEELNAAVNDAAVAAAADGVRAAILAGARACIEFMGRPDYRQIAVADGPAVLGLDRWHEIDRSIGLASMDAGLRALAEEGELDVDVTPAIVVALFGALTELGLAHARGDLSVADAAEGFATLLERLGSPT